MAAKSNANAGQDATLRLQYYRSAIGSPMKHKLIIKGLGFKRLQQVVTRVDTPAVRGMVAHVPHLVKILQSEKAES
jgi:large subunit ribosomal protein L30